MRGRKRFFCSSVPKAITTGPHIDTLKGSGCGTPLNCSSSV